MWPEERPAYQKTLGGRGCRGDGSAARQDESNGDDPDEAGEPGERDQQKEPGIDEIEDAEFSGCGQD